MNSKPLLSLLAGAALLLATGCASIVHGNRQAVQINSTPPGATVTITDKKGKEVCVTNTPATVQLLRGGGASGAKYRLTIELAGYFPSTANVDYTTSGYYFGNFLGLWFVGMLIDIGSGSAWKLEPAEFNIRLAPTTQRAPEGKQP